MAKTRKPSDTEPEPKQKSAAKKATGKKKSTPADPADQTMSTAPTPPEVTLPTHQSFIPGELLVADGEIVLNAGRKAVTLTVANQGDRPIQVGSHFHFFEVNSALRFGREQARGMRLDIPAGTAVRFEPGDEKSVTLVPYAGRREVYGFNALVEGPLEAIPAKKAAKKTSR